MIKTQLYFITKLRYIRKVLHKTPSRKTDEVEGRVRNPTRRRPPPPSRLHPLLAARRVLIVRNDLMHFSSSGRRVTRESEPEAEKERREIGLLSARLRSEALHLSHSWRCGAASRNTNVRRGAMKMTIMAPSASVPPVGRGRRRPSVAHDASFAFQIMRPPGARGEALRGSAARQSRGK